jgi:hypothetical protein
LHPFLIPPSSHVLPSLSLHQFLPLSISLHGAASGLP